MKSDAQETNPFVYEGMRMNNLANVGNMFGTKTNTSTSDPGIGNVALQLGAAYLTGGGSLAMGAAAGASSDGLSSFDTSQYAGMRR